MKIIGGNIEAIFQIKDTTKNEIGESIPIWNDFKKVIGWIDLSSGDSRYTSFDSKREESTYVFFTDYDEDIANLNVENTRVIVKGKVYFVKTIDNPMNLNYHLEISLEYRGGQA